MVVQFFAGSDPKNTHDWPVVDLLSEWWRPAFDSNQVRIVHANIANLLRGLVAQRLTGDIVSPAPPHLALQYPYLPAHCSKPREHAKIYLMQLPESCGFHLPANLALNAVPLYDLHHNDTYGGVTTSSIPTLLSRFTFSTL
jgi:hypothetical protein